MFLPFIFSPLSRLYPSDSCRNGLWLKAFEIPSRFACCHLAGFTMSAEILGMNTRVEPGVSVVVFKVVWSGL